MFGRDPLLDAIDAHLAEGARLVTLHGPAGIGKTRLATAWALRHIASTTPLGAYWFCDMTTATTTRGLLLALAAATGLPFDVAHEGLARGVGEVVAGLRGSGETVLILDNLEQVVEAAGELVNAVLRAWPELRVIATSRARLRLRRERVLEVPPLSSEDGVTLFTARARAAGAGPQLAVSAEDAAAIVARLDGIPLALELAAARAGVLGARAVLERLEREPGLLDSDLLDLPDRHRTLAAAVAWSWGLLSPAEREVLTQLGVFEGSFDLAAAEAVVTLEHAANTDGISVAAVLADLHGKSLVHVQPARCPTPEPRFRLLVPVREFLRQRDAEANALSPAVLRHARWYAQLAERAPDAGDATAVHAALERLTAERDNLFAAHKRVRDAHPGLAARLALAGQAVLIPLGPLDASGDVLDSAVSCAARTGDDALLIHSLHRRGAHHAKLGHADLAAADLERGLALVRLGDDRVAEATLRVELGHLALYRGRYGDGLEQLQVARVLAVQADNPWLEAKAAHFYAEGLANRGPLDGARAALGQAIAVARRASSFFEVLSLLVLARTELELDHLADTDACLRDADEAIQRFQLEPLGLHAGVIRSAILAARGLLPEARRLLAATSAQARKHAYFAHVGYAELWLAVVRVAEGHRGDALAALERARPHVATADAHSQALLRLAERAATPDKASGDADKAHAVGQDERLARRCLATRSGSKRARSAGAAKTSSSLAAARPTWGVGRAGRTLRLPSGEEVSLAERPVGRALLALLAERLAVGPGDPVAAIELFEAGWPGLALSQGAGINRLYVAIGTLRNLGLGQQLVRGRGGYFLNPDSVTTLDT